jgi:hypothetical protein
VTDNSTRVRIGCRILFAMEIYNCYTGYNYNEHYNTGSFLDPTDGTVLFKDSLKKTDFGDRLTDIALTAWTLWRRRNLCSVRYKLGFYIPNGAIFHSYCRENLKSYIALTDCAL